MHRRWLTTSGRGRRPSLGWDPFMDHVLAFARGCVGLDGQDGLLVRVDVVFLRCPASLGQCHPRKVLDPVLSTISHTLHLHHILGKANRWNDPYPVLVFWVGLAFLRGMGKDIGRDLPLKRGWVSFSNRFLPGFPTRRPHDPSLFHPDRTWDGLGSLSPSGSSHPFQGNRWGRGSEWTPLSPFPRSHRHRFGWEANWHPILVERGVPSTPSKTNGSERDTKTNSHHHHSRNERVCVPSGRCTFDASIGKEGGWISTWRCQRSSSQGSRSDRRTWWKWNEQKQERRG